MSINELQRALTGLSGFDEHQRGLTVVDEHQRGLTGLDEHQ